MPVPPEAEELLATEGVEGQFNSVILDLTLGSGSLTMACTKASYSSIAYKADSKQAPTSMKSLSYLILFHDQRFFFHGAWIQRHGGKGKL
jgi:hypothetical protein